MLAVHPQNLWRPHQGHLKTRRSRSQNQTRLPLPLGSYQLSPSFERCFCWAVHVGAWRHISHVRFLLIASGFCPHRQQTNWPQCLWEQTSFFNLLQTWVKQPVYADDAGVKLKPLPVGRTACLRPFLTVRIIAQETEQIWFFCRQSHGLKSVRIVNAFVVTVSYCMLYIMYIIHNI